MRTLVMSLCPWEGSERGMGGGCGGGSKFHYQWPVLKLHEANCRHRLSQRSKTNLWAIFFFFGDGGGCSELRQGALFLCFWGQN